MGRRLRRGLALTATALVAGTVARGVIRRRAVLQAVAPDLRTPLLYVPMSLRSDRVLRLMRRIPGRPGPVTEGVELREHTVAARGEHPETPVYVYEPPARVRPSGVLLWIHGGGFVLGHPSSYHPLCSRIAAELGLLVVSVDYRLAPEHPFPAGLEDCYTALEWIHRNAVDLGVDPARVAIGGDSAGGGLAACLAQLAHDRGELRVGFQLLVYPMLDDRTVLRTDHAGTGDFIWTPVSNRYGWTAYLGHEPREEEPRPYAVAARRPDLSGLPPAWIGVGDLDLFHSEDLVYAERLKVAGVPCELVEVPGMYHGADDFFDGRAESMTQFRRSMLAALRRGVAG
jgi:acetyl esterase/lipase